MGLFGNKKKKVPRDSAAARLDGRELLYAVRRYMDADGSPREDGLGKGGRINTANGHVILTCGGREGFVNPDITTVQCGELMSLAGAIFTGYNELTGGEDTVVVYYAGRLS